MGIECCKLVGNLDLGDAAPTGLISFSVKSSTEMRKTGDNIIIGPTIGSVSATGYASSTIHDGCPGKAGVNIQWVRKYDCVEDKVYFIFAGEGKSYLIGETSSIVRLNNSECAVSYDVLNATASNGPTSLYQQEQQSDSYGLTFTGDPWPFDTSVSDSVVIDTGVFGFSDLYLQSFSIQFEPQKLPIASYEFLYTINNG